MIKLYKNLINSSGEKTIFKTCIIFV